MLTPFAQNLFDSILLPETLPAAHELDLDSIFGGDSLHVCAKRLPQRLGPLRIVEDPHLVRVKIARHPRRVTPPGYRALDDDPVVTGEQASDLAFMPFRQKLNAHSGIVTIFLSGSGYAGLGTFP